MMLRLCAAAMLLLMAVPAMLAEDGLRFSYGELVEHEFRSDGIPSVATHNGTLYVLFKGWLNAKNKDCEWRVWAARSGKIDDTRYVFTPKREGDWPDFHKGAPYKEHVGYWPYGLWIDPADGTWYVTVYAETNYLNYEATGQAERLVGLATSKDGGRSFHWQGTLITQDKSKEPPNAKWSFYGAGDQDFFIHDGYAYVLYKRGFYDRTRKKGEARKRREMCIARAPLRSKLAPGSWKKFYNGRWNQPGDGGKATGLFGGFRKEEVDYATIHYNSCLKNFVVIANCVKSGTSYSLASDINAQDWSPMTPIRGGDTITDWYPWVFDSDTNDKYTCGRQFRLYSSGWKNWDSGLYDRKDQTGMCHHYRNFRWLRDDTTGWRTAVDHAVTKANSTATFAFTGTAARLYGSRGKNLGVVSILLDSKWIADVDCYSDMPEDKLLLFQTETLPKGAHTLTAKPKGRKNPNSKGKTITVKAFSYR